MNMKFIITWLLLLGALPAVSREIYYEQIKYNVISEEDRTVEIGKQDAVPFEHLVIPGFFKDNKTNHLFIVKGVGEDAFNCNTNYLKSIVLPKTIVSIGNRAFYNCKKLESVSFLPEGLTHFGDYVFGFCEALESVRLPADMTTTGHGTFYGCSNLKDFTFSENMTSIGNAYFYWCDSLKLTEIPDNITEIGKNAFVGCYALESVKLPKNLSSISSRMFSGCKNLRELDIPETVTSIGEGAFSNTSLDCSVIPRTITDIPAFLFSWTEMKEIVIPDWIENIGSYAFGSCKTASIIFPPSVKYIGFRAFSDNDLEEVVLPPALKTIGTEAFADNRKLHSVVIPSSVEKIGSEAFGGWTEYTDEGTSKVDTYCRIKTVYCVPAVPPKELINNPPVFFEIVEPDATIYLPKESMELYRQEWPWVFGDNWEYVDRYDNLKFAHHEPLVMAEAVVLACERIEEPEEGDVYELKASVLPEDALQYVFFKSTDTRMATVTQDGVVTIKDPAVNPGDSGIGYCEILVYSVYSEEPMAVCRIGDSTGVEQTVIGGEAPAAAAIDYSLPIEVYSLSGARVASSTEGLQPGVYIIRQGAATAKIAVK